MPFAGTKKGIKGVIDRLKKVNNSIYNFPFKRLWKHNSFQKQNPNYNRGSADEYNI